MSDSMHRKCDLQPASMKKSFWKLENFKSILSLAGLSSFCPQQISTKTNL